jgi:hypothetical protein
MLNDNFFTADQTSFDLNYSNGLVSGIGPSKTNNSPQIYPNPSTGLLNIEIENLSNHYYKVIDAVGKVLQEGKLQTQTLDISNLGAGVYRMVINNDTEMFSTNIIKQ